MKSQFNSEFSVRLAIPTLAAVLFAVMAVGSTPAISQEFSKRYNRAALNGNIKPVLTELAEIDSESLSGKERELAQKVKRRFVDRQESLRGKTDNEFVNDVIRCYREYWTRSLTAEFDASAGDLFLKKKAGRRNRSTF